MLAIEKHQERLAKINQNILLLASNAIRDKTIKGNAKVSIVNLITGSGGASKNDTTGMESEDKLELAKAFLQNADNMRNTLSQDPLYASLIRDFDVQLQDYRREIDEIERLMKEVKTEKEREALKERRDKLRFAA